MANSLILVLVFHFVSVSFLSCEFQELNFQIQKANEITVLALDVSRTATGMVDCASQCALRKNECFNFIFDDSNQQCILAFIEVGSDTTLNLNSPNVYRSCKDVTDTTQPRQLVKLTSGLVVMCDTQTDGGGWTIFQRRVSGAIGFNRNWTEYRNGFGDYGVGDFYLGNENIHCISSKASHELRIDMEYKGISYYALYSFFKLFSEEDGYRLSVSGFGGNVSDDSLSFKSNYQQFSTYDRDNDIDFFRHCANRYKSGWWFSFCHDVNLNGIWGSKTLGESIEWLSITGEWDSLEFTEMKIRPLH
ncbi:microfibril-associated glycoprotein 4-like [Physella acuta]|uniref:microfibril-associated glycoprotein 4-like n=1 Tax=Physella acuta TaxID=109671 RepID=UPI0027DB86E6|nr:microfibril-associated glycoprotein 4-like [Physella acuta]